MAITPDEARARELENRYDRARQGAWAWATRAESEYLTAIKHEDDARAHAESAYMRDAVAEDRRLAQIHGVRSTEALKLAQMWTALAAVLVPPLEPIWADLAEVENTDG